MIRQYRYIEKTLNSAIKIAHRIIIYKSTHVLHMNANFNLSRLKNTGIISLNMDVRHITDTLFPLVQKYKDDEYTELEFRLGKFNGTMFDTNVGKAAFDQMMVGLSKFPGWEKMVGTEHEVFYRDSDGVRISTDQATGDEEIIKKERIINHDFKHMLNTPYDIRFSVSKEVPMPEDVDREMDKKKTKQRLSYVRKNVSIDLTIMTGDSHDMDAEESVTYQVEFEIIVPSSVQTRDDLFKIIHKINDVFIMLNNTR